MIRGVSYFGVRRPKWVAEDMKEIRRLGFTHVLHTYAEEDLEYYRDTMREIIDISVDLGLTVYTNPWGVGRVFGGEAYSELVSKNPSCAQIGSDSVIKPAICPNRPEFKAFLNRWLDAVAETKAETVFWDEPHFYFTKGALQNWSCRCDTCQKLYEERFKEKMPTILTPSVLKFREDSLIQFLTEITKAAHDRDKKNTVCLLPPHFPAGIDDWEKIAAIPTVDEIASDPYQERADSREVVLKNYKETAEKLIQAAAPYDKQTQMWIKNYLIEAGREEDVADSARIAYDAGIRNIFTWSYRSSEYLSWLKSDNPTKAWDTYCHAIQNLH